MLKRDLVEFDATDPPHIRAQLIRWLCADAVAAPSVHPYGVFVNGARFTEDLDLSGVRLDVRLVLQSCHMQQVILNDSRLRSVGLDVPLYRLAPQSMRTYW